MVRIDDYVPTGGVPSGGDVFQAKLLFPKDNVTEEVIAAAKVTKTEEDDDLGENCSVSSKCDGLDGRKDSFNGTT